MSNIYFMLATSNKFLFITITYSFVLYFKLFINTFFAVFFLINLTKLKNFSQPGVLRKVERGRCLFDS